MRALSTILLVVISLSIGLTVAHGEEPQIPLPEGAVARLGLGWMTQIAYSPAGEYLALATSLAVELRDADTLELIRFFHGHTAPVRSVAFSPDGKLLVSAGCADETVKLWDVETGEEVRTLTGHTWNVTSVKKRNLLES